MNLDSRLYDAAIAGDAAAKAEFEQKANRVDEYNRTILHTEAITEPMRFILREFAHKNMLTTYGGHTVLHWAIYGGHTDVAKVLIEAAGNFPDNLAFLRQGDKDNMNTALHVAVMRRNPAITKLLVEADPDDRHIQNNDGETPIYIAAKKGYTDIVKVICASCKTPLNMDGPGGSTALHAAVKNRNHGIEMVQVLIGAARLLSSPSDNDNSITSFEALLRRGDEDSNTALHIAVMQGNLATAKLLAEADPRDEGIQNDKGKTPFYIAVESRSVDIAKMICTTSTPGLWFNLRGPGNRLTTLHAVVKNLDEGKNEVRDVIKMIINIFKSALVLNNIDGNEYQMHRAFASTIFSETDEYNQTILDLAVEQNYVEVVEVILGMHDPAYEDNWIADDFINLVPLIYRASEKGYNDLVKLLDEKYQAGAKLSKHLQNQARLISAIRNRNKDSVFSLLDNHARDLVIFSDSLGWTALHHAVYNQFDAIIKRIVEEQRNFEHSFVYEDMVSTPFHVGAKKGYTSTLILLMKLWPSEGSSVYTAVAKNEQNILHLAALRCEKKMIQEILKNCPEQYKKELVNRQDNNGNTPLHYLIEKGCFVPELIRYEGLHIRRENKEKCNPPDMLYHNDRIIMDQVQIKMALDHYVQINEQTDIFSSLVVSVGKREQKDLIFKKEENLMVHEKHARMKEDARVVANCFIDAIAGDPISRAALEMEADTVNQEGQTILHVESMRGDHERVRYIVKELAHKNLLGKQDTLKQTALHLAAHHGHPKVVEVLTDAARHLPSSSADHPVSSFQAFIRQAGPKGNTPLHLAVLKGNVAIAKLLLKMDPDDTHAQNNEGKTPIYIAAENGNVDILKEICTARTALSLDGPGGRTTALHALVQNINQGQEGATDVIRMLVNAAKLWSTSADFEALFSRTDESETTVLQLAMKINYVDAVQLLLQEDPAYQHGREIKRNGLMHLIFKAIDNKYSDDFIKLLSQTYESGINPDHRDVLSLILAMKRHDDGTILSLLRGAKYLVTFEEENGWTPLHYAVYHEFDSIIGAIIEAQEDAGHQFVYGDKVPTPFHVAIEHGYASTLVRLMQLWPASLSQSIVANSPYTTIDENRRNILHLAALAETGDKIEMVQGILKYCPENFKDMILHQKDINGDTPLHLLISQGCFIPELIKHKGLDTMAKKQEQFDSSGHAVY